MTFLAIIWSCIIIPTLALDSCLTVQQVNDVYIPKTRSINFLYVNFGISGTSFPQCIAQCTMLRFPLCQWSSNGICWGFYLPPESYTTYNNRTQDLIYVNTKLQNSIQNYNLVSVGNSTSPSMTVYGSGRYYKEQKSMPRFSMSFFPSNNASVDPAILDLEGIGYNWITRALAVCGGKQSNQSASNSSYCYFLLTEVPTSIIGPWKGPLVMVQGRQSPRVVPYWNRMFIIGGLISDPALEVVEYISTVQNKIFSMVTLDINAKMVNNVMFCTAGLDDLGAIFVAGGNLSGTVVSNAFLLDVKNTRWITLPNMKKARRQHECERVKRFGHDYIVAVGGSDQTGAFVSTIEFYDLTAKPSAWEVGSMILPTAAQGNYAGSVIIKFDETGCEAMFLSLTNSKLHKCNNNFIWTSESVANTNGPVAKIDLQLFLA